MTESGGITNNQGRKLMSGDKNKSGAGGSGQRSGQAGQQGSISEGVKRPPLSITLTTKPPPKPKGKK